MEVSPGQAPCSMPHARMQIGTCMQGPPFTPPCLRFRRLPGYQGWPLLGNLLEIQQSWHGLHEMGAARFGPLFKMWYGAEPHVALTSSEACKQVRLLADCQQGGADCGVTWPLRRSY